MAASTNIPAVVISDPTTSNDQATVTAGALNVGGTVSVTNFANPLPVSQNGVWTNTVTQATGTNLHTVLDSGTLTTLTTVTNPVTVSQATAANLNATVTGTVSVNALPTGSNSIGKVDILGNAGATLDAVITAATAPANALAILSINNTTAPSLTTGQSVAQQCDYEGSIFVKPYRRGQVVAKTTPIAATTVTTVLAAQAAGIFADISNFVLTPTPITTSAAATATLSDGTASYIFDLISGQAAVLGTTINITFNPPLPATSAATAWTVTMSTTNAVHVTVVAVLQKAS